MITAARSYMICAINVDSDRSSHHLSVYRVQPTLCRTTDGLGKRVLLSHEVSTIPVRKYVKNNYSVLMMQGVKVPVSLYIYQVLY